MIKLLQDIVSDEIKSIRYLNNGEETLSVVVDYIDDALDEEVPCDNVDEKIDSDNLDVSDYDRGYADGRWETQVEIVKRLGLYGLSGKEVADIVGLICEPVDNTKEE